jgi:hypothetical protein
VKVNKNDTNVLNWERLAELFNAKSVREMSEEEYEAEFGTKLPEPRPTPKPARPRLADPWVEIAEKILERDFCEEPIDRSTKDSWVIGLRANIDPASKAALTKLKQTKPIIWGKKDKAAGTLLSRRKKINNPLASEAV